MIDYDDNNEIVGAYTTKAKLTKALKEMAKENDMLLNRVMDRFGYETTLLQ